MDRCDPRCEVCGTDYLLRQTMQTAITRGEGKRTVFLALLCEKCACALVEAARKVVKLKEPNHDD